MPKANATPQPPDLGAEDEDLCRSSIFPGELRVDCLRRVGHNGQHYGLAFDVDTSSDIPKPGEQDWGKHVTWSLPQPVEIWWGARR